MSALTQETLDAITILKELIKIPSLSKAEDKTADVLEQFLLGKNLAVQRQGNNVWVKSEEVKTQKPVILLNSHHDTVKPNSSYTRDPFSAEVEDGKLYGLGSNDAGGPLVALLFTFLRLIQKEQPYTLIFAATAEEEISGKNGIASILPTLGKIDLGIVGEPTLCQMAVAEKGLMVLDGTAKGKAGHAAREEGINSIYELLPDLAWFRDFEFPKISPNLGKVKMSVTQINAGTQHNVVPDKCSFVVDVRSTEQYSNQKIFEIIQSNVKAEMQARSFRLNSSGIADEHPVVKRGKNMGLTAYGSPTLSDQALMPFTTLKIGPGESARSHTANEFIYVEEIEKGIATYVALLDGLVL
jgi:acetylornithine deacetylase